MVDDYSRWLESGFGLTTADILYWRPDHQRLARRAGALSP
jgi:uncharacterized protein Usg